MAYCQGHKSTLELGFSQDMLKKVLIIVRPLELPPVDLGFKDPTATQLASA